MILKGESQSRILNMKNQLKNLQNLCDFFTYVQWPYCDLLLKFCVLASNFSYVCAFGNIVFNDSILFGVLMLTKQLTSWLVEGQIHQSLNIFFFLRSSVSLSCTLYVRKIKVWQICYIQLKLISAPSVVCVSKPCCCQLQFTSDLLFVHIQTYLMHF